MVLTRDLGLTFRMGIALLALGILYIALGYSIAMLFGLFVAPTGIAHFFGIGISITLLAVGQYYYGANIALRLMNANVVSRSEYPELHDKAQKLAQQAGVPTPRIAVSPNKTPNAFAAGRGTSNAVICVTEGSLRELDEDELEAVLAHEMAHIMNRDFRLMTMITALSAAAGWLVRWGFLFGDGGGDSRNVMYYIWGYVIAIFVWVGAFLVGRMISRYREYAADRGASELTGDPLALASALRTISETKEETPKEDLREAQQVNALLAAEVTKHNRVSSLVRTHPDVESRVENLETIAVEMEEH